MALEVFYLQSSKLYICIHLGLFYKGDVHGSLIVHTYVVQLLLLFNSLMCMELTQARAHSNYACYALNSIYHIARKFDGELNLAVLWSGLKLPN